MKRILPLLAILLVLPLHLSAQTIASSSVPSTMQSAYGQKLRVTGIPNAGRITDALYRGAQPEKPGLAALKIMGIGTIVDLRAENHEKAAWERNQAESLDMHFVYIPVGPFSAPTDAQVAEFLSLIRDHPGQKIFVHCRYGEDRTGVFVAAYRIAFEKWPAEQVLKEMNFFGFHGFWQTDMKSFIHDFPSLLKTAPALSAFRDASSQP